MKELNFSTDIALETDNKLINSLKNDKRVINFIVNNNLDISIVEKYPYKFKNWIDDLDICNLCNGLNYCKQGHNGMYFDLKYDGVFNKELVACKYKIEDNIKRNHLNNYYVNDLSETMKFVNFENLNIDNEDDEYIDNVNNVIDCIELKTYGLYIYGTIGSGKTYLAACACNKLAKEGNKVSFVNLPLFSLRIKTKLENNEYQKEVRQLINSDFLVIDDIGAESVTSWFRDDILFTILNERMENKRLTWFTSNEDLVSLEKHFEIGNRKTQEKIKAERIISRIKTLSKPLKLFKIDRRII